MLKKIFIDGEFGTTGIQIRSHLRAHPEVEIISIAEGSRKDLTIRKKLMESSDVTILCLPDDAAKELVSSVKSLDCRLIDASSIHRTSKNWVYGLPELSKENRERIKNARLLANPGCFATGAILLLRPLILAGTLRKDERLTINAVSGYSGGGSRMISEYEGERPPFGYSLYGLHLGHKHLPEIMCYSGLFKKPIFIPSVANFYQGMLVSVPLFLRDGLSADDVRNCLTEYYRHEPFVKVAPKADCDYAANSMLDAEISPASNTVSLYVCSDSSPLQDDRVILIAKLDNLGKGASTAAIQNLNIMLGFPDSLGLPLP
jgi:N-acetyl-gamma-glutamyl-phosphate reductase